MTLTLRILGARTPYPTHDHPCSGFLIDTSGTDASGTLVLVELGLGVWPELLRNANPGDLAAIWVSHLHPDHCGDLFAAYQWAANTHHAPRLPIYGPPGWAERIGAALPVHDGQDQIRRLFDVREHSNTPQQVGQLTLSTVPVQHSVPCFGLRLTDGAHTLAYSGDSGPCDALVALAAHADIFLCEAGTTEQRQIHHCSPEDAARIGSTAKHLVLTHLGPGLTPDDASRRADNATIAHPGLVLRCA